MTLEQMGMLCEHFKKVYFNTFDSQAWEHAMALEVSMTQKAQDEAEQQAEALNGKYKNL